MLSEERALGGYRDHPRRSRPYRPERAAGSVASGLASETGGVGP